MVVKYIIKIDLQKCDSGVAKKTTMECVYRVYAF